MENKVMEKIGKEADNVLKEKLLKGLDDEKAEIETMKEIKEKYGFKKGGLVKQGKPKLAKKRMEIMLKKIKNKICKIICKVFKIKPCVCDHECNCNKENK
jgi:hypothetical protein